MSHLTLFLIKAETLTILHTNSCATGLYHKHVGAKLTSGTLCGLPLQSKNLHTEHIMSSHLFDVLSVFEKNYTPGAFQYRSYSTNRLFFQPLRILNPHRGRKSARPKSFELEVGSYNLHNVIFPKQNTGGDCHNEHYNNSHRPTGKLIF